MLKQGGLVFIGRSHLRLLGASVQFEVRGRKQSAADSKALWILWCADHPALKAFAEDWTARVEARLQARGTAASRVFAATLEEAGGADMKTGDLQEVVMILSTVWKHGLSLRSWVRRQKILPDSGSN